MRARRDRAPVAVLVPRPPIARAVARHSAVDRLAQLEAEAAALREHLGVGREYQVRRPRSLRSGRQIVRRFRVQD